MSYRISEIEVPDGNPYLNDALERKPLVEFLSSLIERAKGPFVLALDSPWGTGKTTLVQMISVELKRRNLECVYFNAWEVDHADDPLVALVASVDLVQLSGTGATSFKKHMKTIRRVTNVVAKRAVVAAAKAVTAGALDIEDDVKKVAEELAGEMVGDIVKEFQKERQLLEKFKKELHGAVSELERGGKVPPLVIFIDELDRCRPSFAIQLLERIKHLFDVPNLIFVISIDKRQLEASTAAVYGQGIDAREYLRRFIDLEYALPGVRGKRYTEVLFSRSGLDAVFAKRTHPDLHYDRQNFIDTFTFLADAASMSLRARARCITRLKVVMDQTPDNTYLLPSLAALLVVLRSNSPDLFAALQNGSAGSNEVMQYLRSQPNGSKIVNDRGARLLEAELIARDPDDARRKDAMNNLAALRDDEAQEATVRERAKESLEFIAHYRRGLFNSLDLTYLGKKIDISAGIRE